MKLTAKLSGFESIARLLTRHAGTVAARASEAAADALALELDRARETEGISAPLLRGRAGNRHSVGVDDAGAIEREFGTLTQEPTPWLVPVLPAARRPMRAAVVTAVARAISSSGFRKR